MLVNDGQKMALNTPRKICHIFGFIFRAFPFWERNASTRYYSTARISRSYADAAKPIMAELRPRFQEAMKIGDPAAREAAIDKLQEVSAAKLPPATLSR
ncbi:MAG TPA: hypothetical protein VH117_02830 [Edaphobacter sp.]|jgi:hypothetical protein|nr:hypothetical protein [Edaphobacter sp.]